MFATNDGAYNPVISDGRLLYMTGYRVIYALKPGKGKSENGFVVRGRRRRRSRRSYFRGSRPVIPR